MTLQVLLSVLLLSVGLARSGSYVKRDVSEITKDVLQESAESPETTEESDENDEEEEDDDDDNDSDDDEESPSEESESAEENGNKEEESSSESSPSHRNRQKKMRANKRYLNRGLNTSETSLYQEDQTLI
ncbi:probable dual specificity protein phosphatase DDB_G0281963 isoform X8 [Haliotis rubra]|uniref:probable dual specificity protein phosphatase DDB_G0281963 isoform X8 n=1 Tax=Haliotis rubra TaxID=36100 RepID=UPI001EE56905|nr:probable dual specificity protein phosphatase DDB_G0281963 isoform X8 [Haliotis rubra]